MKKLLSLGVLLWQMLVFAQIPAGYYNGTENLTGAALKTKLSQIITNGHMDKGYSALLGAYPSTDIDKFFENDNTVLDIYSENPTGTDPYTYSFSNNCGTYQGEGSCYNREHVIPQSFFSDASPMRNDIHHVRPTDGYVNGKRGTYPFGKVGTATYTSMNGSKIGTCVYPGYSGIVFEPIDRFKGDIARMIFYFVTRYENQLSGFATGNMMAQNTYPSLQPWFKTMLIEWSNNDPVSPEEISRNNASYVFQGNRNPYIDHPEFVNAVWGTPITDTTPPNAPLNLNYSNITNTSVQLSWSAATDNVGVVSYEVYNESGTLLGTVSGTTLTLNNLTPNTTYTVYVKAKDAAGNISSASNTVTFTTTNTTTPTPPTSPISCGTEDFQNIPPNSSSYTTRTWTNNGITWTADNARTDNSINSRALTFKTGNVTSSTIPGGISSLTLSTKLPYSDSAGNLNIKINGQSVGTIPYNSAVATTTISNFNIQGNITITIENTTANRVSIDDLSWTCAQALSTEEVLGSSDAVMLSPNPVRDGYINIISQKKFRQAKILDMSGRLVKVVSSDELLKKYVSVRHLPKGMYLLQLDQKSYKFVID